MHSETRERHGGVMLSECHNIVYSAFNFILFYAQVLKKVSDIFGYKNIEDFMTSHLDYLVVEWLKIKDSGYSLSAFPYVLLNYTGLEEFYR